MSEIISGQSLHAAAPPPIEQQPNPTIASHRWFDKALNVASIGGSTIGSILFLTGNAELAGVVGKVGLGAFVTRMLRGLLRGRGQKNGQ
ncbi:hypothetical protein COU89_00055 [Candidatus Roizmanbacteria bacterium CG10_big_fil_rev_8_21_14_0_10_45_7]|uniref:Uncharacterized protein n=1 Tax=Candidatus Roizmanbacteria bacterium CG10_big_fil_rev_8_21_14_0_10_45_7 TaxID=1974854 RepID=A0A2M8KVV9_9BACT|nr:MAG: hypothetical protein COU89_00055 [Candidatus Roizmanbacteria bacterium CG10_big_fil_rev_8_21_14_0_10_45_7]